jgi:hypothetical protein
MWLVDEKKTPPLLIALRGDPEVYNQALRWLYKLNNMRLDSETMTRLDSIPQKEFERIRSVLIE